MLYPGLPFTQKIRAEFRKEISAHPRWRGYRKNTPKNIPQLHAMTRDQILETCDALGLNVWAIVDRVDSQWGKGRRYRAARSNASHDMRTDAVRKLQELGYIYVGEKWQKKPEW